MEIIQMLSYLGGYFNSKEFDLDVEKMASTSELSEEEFLEELNILHNSGDIKLIDNKIELINIQSKVNNDFNDEYQPIETIEFTRGIKLDKGA